MVLTDIKKLLGLAEDYDAFDTDIRIHINSSLAILKQLGVNVTGILTESGSEDWSDVLGSNVNLGTIKDYIYLKVKMIFDPALNGSIIEANKEMLKELEWRINLEVEISSDTTYSGSSN